MTQKIILLTGNNSFFGQTRKPWVSIDSGKLVKVLRDNGFDVTEYSFHQYANKDINITNYIIIYTFSQIPNFRHYIKDIIYSLKMRGNTLLPSYELLLCHENKGYQELLKKELNIDSLKALYLNNKSELADFKLEFPIVLKTIDGSNGKGVFLVSSQAELVKKLSWLEPRMSVSQKIDLFRRRYLRFKSSFPGYSSFDNNQDYEQYKEYITPKISFILQQYIHGLEYDYRVIVMGEHFYVTKRMVKKGDFRASGAKQFTFDFQASAELLDYASELYEKFNSPCLSIDVGAANDSLYLFEFQAQHFGINAIVRGKGYYQKSGSEWVFIKKQPDFEHELASAYIHHIKKQNLV